MHHTTVRALEWRGGVCGVLVVLDQTRLPAEVVHLECRSLDDVSDAIVRLAVRGAPAIGVAAAYGMVLGLRDEPGDRKALLRRAVSVGDSLIAVRPTAVNLAWAVRRVLDRAREADRLPSATPATLLEAMLAEAHRIAEEDRQMCQAMAEIGAPLLPDRGGVLTHCNTGALATAGVGTALGVVIHAARSGKSVRIYADETRPLFQGARLTAWELVQAGLDVTVVTEGCAGHLLASGAIDAVLVGADRIARNGDVANKIGTYGLAVLARHHGVPFYVVAPTSSFDLDVPSGGHIPIEERDPDEVRKAFGVPLTPEGASAYNPAFDVTPAALVTAIITERGIIGEPTEERVVAWLRPPAGS